MKNLKILTILLFLSNIFYYSNSFAQNEHINSYKEDSLNIIYANEEWTGVRAGMIKFSFNVNQYKPWARNEYAEKTLQKITEESPYYIDRLKLESEMNQYFEYWQPIVDERYNYYHKALSGAKKYKTFLRKLIDFGFIQKDTFFKSGNSYTDYELYEYDKNIKIEVQIEINYAYDISFEVYVSCR